MDRRDCIRWGGAALVAPLLAGQCALGAVEISDRARSVSSSPMRRAAWWMPWRANWADRMKAPLGTVIIENQGGGGGTIGASAVAHAKPDGYTLLFGDTSSQIIAPYLDAESALRRRPRTSRRCR